MTLEEMPARDNKPPRKRLILHYQGRERGLVLNMTNQSFVEARLGQNPNDWIGATVVLHRTTTLYAGETVAAFRLTECRKVAGPKPAAKAPQPIPVEPIEDDDDSVPF